MSSQALPDQTEIAILEYLSEYNSKLLTFGSFAKKKGTTLFGTSNKNGSAAQKVLRKRVENRLNYLKKLDDSVLTALLKQAGFRKLYGNPIFEDDDDDDDYDYEEDDDDDDDDDDDEEEDDEEEEGDPVKDKEEQDHTDQQRGNRKSYFFSFCSFSLPVCLKLTHICDCTIFFFLLPSTIVLDMKSSQQRHQKRHQQ